MVLQNYPHGFQPSLIEALFTASSSLSSGKDPMGPAP